jgi:cation transport regulator ChaB
METSDAATVQAHDAQSENMSGQDMTEQETQLVEDAPLAVPYEDEETINRDDTASGKMTVDALPEDVKDCLPVDAQHSFVAAFNAFFENSNDQELAMQSAWKSLELDEHYTRGEDGKWTRLPDTSGPHAPISGTAA